MQNSFHTLDETIAGSALSYEFDYKNVDTAVKYACTTLASSEKLMIHLKNTAQQENWEATEFSQSMDGPLKKHPIY